MPLLFAEVCKIQQIISWSSIASCNTSGPVINSTPWLTDVQMCRPYGSGTPVTVQLTPHRNVTDVNTEMRKVMN
ncbi:hypothetical protein KOW79_012485 [Hemibagrus wyckioides]|uniref:Uncharacterized protein n=1 Tax=Hemibagrus wyckioides TaxID=337641 RepID=A0A9D3SMA6_9TELE|nr:hypothetical protein KOW79_012485 [Hemibagrus wyckioides]